MATKYINADSGVDGAAGDEANPWLLLSYAIANTSPGDIIICQDSVNTFAWPTIANQTDRTIQGEQIDGSGAIFDAGSTHEQWRIGGTWVMQKLQFKNFVATGIGSGGQTAFRAYLNANWLIEDCKFIDCEIYGRSDGAECFIGDRDIWTGLGIFESCIIRNCDFINLKSNSASGGTGILFGINASTNANALDIYNCNFFFKETTYPIGAITCLNSGKAGTEMRIRNSSFSNIGTSKPFYVTVAPAVSYLCTDGFTSVPAGTGNIADDPKFVDGAADDLDLRQDSPIIGQGVNI